MKSSTKAVKKKPWLADDAWVDADVAPNPPEEGTDLEGEPTGNPLEGAAPNPPNPPVAGLVTPVAGGAAPNPPNPPVAGLATPVAGGAAPNPPNPPVAGLATPVAGGAAPNPPNPPVAGLATPVAGGAAPNPPNPPVVANPPEEVFFGAACPKVGWGGPPNPPVVANPPKVFFRVVSFFLGAENFFGVAGCVKPFPFTGKGVTTGRGGTTPFCPPKDLEASLSQSSAERGWKDPVKRLLSAWRPVCWCEK